MNQIEDDPALQREHAGKLSVPHCVTTIDQEVQQQEEEMFGDTTEELTSMVLFSSISGF